RGARAAGGGGAPAPGRPPAKGEPADKAAERQKFRDYFDFAEPAKKLPSHRILALRRGEKEGFLRLALEVDRDASLARLQPLFVKNPRAALARDFAAALEDAYDR